MRVRSMIAAAGLALALPAAAHAADMPGIVAWGANCGGLQPVDVFVPPQNAYIVACTVPLPEPGVLYKPARRGFWARLLGQGSDEMVATVDWRYGNPNTQEGKLVYLQQWSADRPPVHFLVVPK